MKPYIYVTTVENDRAMVYTEFIHGMREYARDRFHCTSILMKNHTLDVKESIDVIMKKIEEAESHKQPSSQTLGRCGRCKDYWQQEDGSGWCEKFESETNELEFRSCFRPEREDEK